LHARDDRLTAVDDVAPGPGFAHAVTVSGRLAFISVARFGWYVLDAGQVQVVRDVRDAAALGDRPNPASTLVQVAALFRPGFLVEVDAVVALPQQGRDPAGPGSPG
jgi:enamine deaminase RidA (YjgF/YER057c/UK114 family)